MDFQKKTIPIFFIPTNSTEHRVDCDSLILKTNVNISGSDGIQTCLYHGPCQIQFIDTFSETVESTQSSNSENTEGRKPTLNSSSSKVRTGEYSTDFSTEVWLEEESRRNYVYNQYISTDSDDPELVPEELCITFGNGFVQEVYSTVVTCASDDYEQNYFRLEDEQVCNLINYFEDDIEVIFPELQVDMKLEKNNEEANKTVYFEVEADDDALTQLMPSEMQSGSKQQTTIMFDIPDLENSNDSDALKQLMASEMQSGSKKQKTIMFDGPDLENGQTIQKIDVSDSSLECLFSQDEYVEVIQETAGVESSKQKKYQCSNCNQLFETRVAFRSHRKNTMTKAKEPMKIDFMCEECGKHLKSPEKFEAHCLAHGNPELECELCHKVFASKFTLRAHHKIHTRKYPCSKCSRTYAKLKALKTHLTKFHHLYLCKKCEYTTINYEEFKSHRISHSVHEDESSDAGYADPYISGLTSYDDPGLNYKDRNQNDVEQADLIIGKILSNKMFLSDSKRQRQLNKTCNICQKPFDRLSDVKRHLIEHLVKKIRTKTIIKDGIPTDTCPLPECQLTFDKVDKLKAHLRSHANLTLYQCNFCDKSFSDSSNFSKHKKVHGAKCFQCDLCQRKFNSKKMIEQHMDYHKKHSPLSCGSCSKVFYFESMLNKHVKCFHDRELRNRFRCQVCCKHFKCLKDKWDHEWKVHKVRKTAADCSRCSAKFRKYSELKRHCIDQHNIELPSAKKLMKKNKSLPF